MKFAYAFVAAWVSLAAAQSAIAETIVLVAGAAAESDPAVATKAKLRHPFGVDRAAGGDLLVIEMEGQVARAINAQGVIATIAGTGEKGFGGNGGPANKAQLAGPHNLVVGPGGDIYIADTYNRQVRKIDHRTGVITSFAGTGKKGFSGDGGPAVKAELGDVYCVAFNPNQTQMYIADLDNRRIRRIDMPTGIIDTVAGNGQQGVPADGSEAVRAPLVDPRAVAADDQGNIYILERKGNALRVVDPLGKIRTVVGPSLQDSGAAKGADTSPLRGPKHLCIDKQGNVLIADSDNHQILRYSPADKKLTRIAGTGKAGAAGIGGPPLDAQLNQPHGVFVDTDGTLYIADSTNHRVLKIVE